MRDYSLSQLAVFDYLGNEYIGDLQRLALASNRLNSSPLSNPLTLTEGTGGTIPQTRPCFSFSYRCFFSRGFSLSRCAGPFPETRC